MVTVAEIFGEAQHSTGVHRKCFQKLADLQKQNNAAFFKEFVRCLQHILVVSKREPVVERMVKFVSAYVCLYSEESTRGVFFVRTIVIGTAQLMSNRDCS